MNHVKSRDLSRDVGKASRAAVLDGEKARGLEREQGDHEKEDTEETKVGNARKNVRVSACSFR